MWKLQNPEAFLLLAFCKNSLYISTWKAFDHLHAATECIIYHFYAVGTFPKFRRLCGCLRPFPMSWPFLKYHNSTRLLNAPFVGSIIAKWIKWQKTPTRSGLIRNVTYASQVFAIHRWHHWARQVLAHAFGDSPRKRDIWLQDSVWTSALLGDHGSLHFNGFARANAERQNTIHWSFAAIDLDSCSATLDIRSWFLDATASFQLFGHSRPGCWYRKKRGHDRFVVLQTVVEGIWQCVPGSACPECLWWSMFIFLSAAIWLSGIQIRYSMGCAILRRTDQGFWHTLWWLRSFAEFTCWWGPDDVRSLHRVRELVQHYNWCDLHVPWCLGWDSLCWNSSWGAVPIRKSPRSVQVVQDVYVVQVQIETDLTPAEIDHRWTSFGHGQICVETFLYRFLLYSFRQKDGGNTGDAFGFGLWHSYLQWCELVAPSSVWSSGRHACAQCSQWPGLCKAITSEASSRSCLWDRPRKSALQCCCLGSRQWCNCLVGNTRHSHPSTQRCETNAQLRCQWASGPFGSLQWVQFKKYTEGSTVR